MPLPPSWKHDISVLLFSGPEGRMGLVNWGAAHAAGTEILNVLLDEEPWAAGIVAEYVGGDWLNNPELLDAVFEGRPALLSPILQNAVLPEASRQFLMERICGGIARANQHSDVRQMSVFGDALVAAKRVSGRIPEVVRDDLLRLVTGLVTVSLGALDAQPDVRRAAEQTRECLLYALARLSDHTSEEWLAIYHAARTGWSCVSGERVVAALAAEAPQHLLRRIATDDRSRSPHVHLVLAGVPRARSDGFIRHAIALSGDIEAIALLCRGSDGHGRRLLLATLASREPVSARALFADHPELAREVGAAALMPLLRAEDRALRVDSVRLLSQAGAEDGELREDEPYRPQGRRYGTPALGGGRVDG